MKSFMLGGLWDPEAEPPLPLLVVGGAALAAEITIIITIKSSIILFNLLPTHLLFRDLGTLVFNTVYTQIKMNESKYSGKLKFREFNDK